jgi:acyl-CoA synthetase (AMP-forming)/AMP-acid ligase II
MPTHVLEALRSHARRKPSDVFCHLLRRGTWSAVTYEELARCSAAYAEHYRGLRLPLASPVLVVLEHGTELFYAFLGAMLAGLVPSFMPFASRKQQPHRFWATHTPLFERIGAGAIVTWPGNVEAMRAALPGKDIRMLVPGDVDDAARRTAELGPIDTDMDRVALLQHSSGTTGMKKGVQLSYGAIARQVDALREIVPLHEDDHIASWLPLYHDMGLIGCFIAPLTLGIGVAALDPFEWVARPGLLFDAVERYRCTHVWLPNFAFHHLARTVEPDEPRDLSSLRSIIDCSEPCRAETLEAFLQKFRSWGLRREHLQVAYGMAENVFLLTQTRAGDPVNEAVVDADAIVARGRAVPAVPGGTARRVLSVGSPPGGVEIGVADPEGRLLQDDQVGEIVSRAPFIFSGYFRNEALTREKFRDGYYLTGDMGFTRAGELYVLGRRDDRIIVSGKNFLAHDIEHVVNGVPGVKGGRVVALGRFSAELGSEEVVVVAEASFEDHSTWPKLHDDVRRAVLTELNLSVRHVLVVSQGWIIKTTSGKISREANLAKYLESMASHQPPESPWK